MAEPLHKQAERLKRCEGETLDFAEYFAVRVKVLFERLTGALGGLER